MKNYVNMVLVGERKRDKFQSARRMHKKYRMIVYSVVVCVFFYTFLAMESIKENIMYFLTPIVAIMGIMRKSSKKST